jgi:hypothetical protein
MDLPLRVPPSSYSALARDGRPFIHRRARPALSLVEGSQKKVRRASAIIMHKKINLQSFTIVELTARLVTMLRNMPRVEDLSKEEYVAAARKACEHHFIFPDGMLEAVTGNFILFSLGNEDNKFSKILKEHSPLGA